MRSARSPARASSPAVAEPAGPPPTMIASNDFAETRRTRDISVLTVVLDETLSNAFDKTQPIAAFDHRFDIDIVLAGCRKRSCPPHELRSLEWFGGADDID